MSLLASAREESSGYNAATGHVQSINEMVSSAGSLVKSKCFMKVSHLIPSNSIDRNLVSRGNDRAYVCSRSDAYPTCKWRPEIVNDSSAGQWIVLRILSI